MIDRREFLAAGLALPFLLGSAPAAMTRRLGGTPLALVTADTEAQVVAVELGTGRIVRRIATLEEPRSIEAVLATKAVVAHTGEGAVSILDGITLAVERVVRSFSRPRYAAAHRTGRYVYVTDSGNGELVTLDLSRGRVVHRLELSGPARHVTISPGGQTVWTALGTRAEHVAVVDTSDPAAPRLGHRLLPPFLAHDVVFSPTGQRVWVTSGNRHRVALYDTAMRQVVQTLSADAAPQHVTFKVGYAFVTSGDDGTLRIHRARDGRVVRTVDVPAGSYNVAGGWLRVFAPSLSQGTLCILDEHGSIVRSVDVAPAAHDACFVVSR